MKYPLFFFLSIKKVFTIIQSLFSTITVLPNMCLQDNSYYKKKSMWLPDETKLNAIPNCRAYQHLKDLCSSSFRTKSKFQKLLYQKKKKKAWKNSEIWDPTYSEKWWKMHEKKLFYAWWFWFFVPHSQEVTETPIGITIWGQTKQQSGHQNLDIPIHSPAAIDDCTYYFICLFFNLEKK